MTTIFGDIKEPKTGYTIPTIPQLPTNTPGVVLLDPYTPPPGTTDATSISDIAQIIPLDIIISSSINHVYDVGVEPEYKLEFSIRNLAVNASLEIGIVVPSFIKVSTALGVTITNISPAFEVELENGAAIVSIGPRQYRKIIFTISEIDCLNLTLQEITTLTENIEIYIDCPNLTGPVHVAPWKEERGSNSNTGDVPFGDVDIDYTGGII